jgi:hypothetical protein
VWLRLPPYVAGARGAHGAVRRASLPAAGLPRRVAQRARDTRRESGGRESATATGQGRRHAARTAYRGRHLVRIGLYRVGRRH